MWHMRVMPRREESGCIGSHLLCGKCSAILLLHLRRSRISLWARAIEGSCGGAISGICCSRLLLLSCGDLHVLYMS